MSNRIKNAIYSGVLIMVLVGVWLYRQSGSNQPIKIEGETMGTTYHITYFDTQRRNFKPQIDSLLDVFNQSLSTYIPNSEISQFNSGRSFIFKLPYFKTVLNRSAEIFSQSHGAFDPTVMPLVNAWGFGPGVKIGDQPGKIDSIKQIIGMDKIAFNADSVWKEDTRAQLDFSAIAKGYGVDVVSRLLQAEGIDNLFVEIGGEIVAKGQNLLTNREWQVGILDPNSTIENRSYYAFISLNDGAIATSGNYFNYYEENGRKYSHTIDPSTGYPVQREILSASVFAGDCMTADAWATAFMVLGHQKAIELLRKHPELDAFLIYSDGNNINSFATEKLMARLTINSK